MGVLAALRWLPPWEDSLWPERTRVDSFSACRVNGLIGRGAASWARHGPTEVDISAPDGVQGQGGIARGTVLRVKLSYVFVKAGFVRHVRAR